MESVLRSPSLLLGSCDQVGACCTAVLVTETLLVVANSGDCKAILSRRHGAEVQPLNAQLNANCPAERQRLREEHPNEDNVVSLGTVTCFAVVHASAGGYGVASTW